MGVFNLPKGENQPFYNVMVEDGSVRYAAEENLAPIEEDGARIGHAMVGQYFKGFRGKYYEPNDELSEQYPEDKALVGQI